MPNNQYVNKVVFNGTTLMDVSGTTVAADKLLEGYTAIGPNGQPITGSLQQQSVDFTGVNVTADKLLKGYKAVAADGSIVEGTFDVDEILSAIEDVKERIYGDIKIDNGFYLRPTPVQVVPPSTYTDGFYHNTVVYRPVLKSKKAFMSKVTACPTTDSDYYQFYSSYLPKSISPPSVSASAYEYIYILISKGHSYNGIATQTNAFSTDYIQKANLSSSNIMRAAFANDTFIKIGDGRGMYVDMRAANPDISFTERYVIEGYDDLISMLYYTSFQISSSNYFGISISSSGNGFLYPNSSSYKIKGYTDTLSNYRFIIVSKLKE